MSNLQLWKLIQWSIIKIPKEYIHMCKILFMIVINKNDINKLLKKSSAYWSQLHGITNLAERYCCLSLVAVLIFLHF